MTQHYTTHKFTTGRPTFRHFIWDGQKVKYSDGSPCFTDPDTFKEWLTNEDSLYLCDESGIHSNIDEDRILSMD